MILKCAGFDEVVDAGARYHGPSRRAEPTLQIAHNGIADSPDDLVILDDAVLTPHAGIAWRGFWIADAVQYMGPNRDWTTANWLPGRYDAATHTIDIDARHLEPQLRIEEPLFYVDTTIGSSNFGHFVFDTLPYGLLFQRVRRSVPAIRPIVLPFSYQNQEELFEVVFDFAYQDVVRHLHYMPILVEQLAVPRRQTDMEPMPWRFSFAGLRHVRDAAVRRWAHLPPAAAQARPAGWRDLVRSSRLSPARRREIRKREMASGAKVYLHRVQDVDALSRAGNLQGRNFTNIAALTPLLSAKGYAVHDPATTALDDLVAILSRAEVVVAIHGAGLANSAFAPPGTQIYEITGPDSAWRCFEGLSAVLGHDFTELCQSRQADPQHPSLDIERLATVL
ncbi:MAG TPA: glycosyltransferase family 61 protein [Stellaceae bacterium]|jgi:hypothetical protein|nr:glycosyltransferase family 61 protein [Stellaceae bacterium]